MLTILISFKKFDPKSITDIINKEITKVAEWLNLNKLHIKNTNKIVAVLFHTRQRTINESMIKINGDTIPFSTHTKCPDVSIDNNVTWKPHINYIITKISKGIGILLHLEKKFTKIYYLSSTRH